MQTQAKKPRVRREYVETTWECWTYDVWGNEKDGFEVNDRYKQGEFTLRVPVERHNIGTEREFSSAYPTDKQIRECLGIKPRFRLEIDGDDMSYYVRHERSGYPLGEMYCTSHVSLSPIRTIAECQHGYRHERRDDNGNVITIVCGEPNCYHKIEELKGDFA